MSYYTSVDLFNQSKSYHTFSLFFNKSENYYHFLDSVCCSANQSVSYYTFYTVKKNMLQLYCTHIIWLDFILHWCTGKHFTILIITLLSPFTNFQ